MKRMFNKARKLAQLQPFTVAEWLVIIAASLLSLAMRAGQ